MWTWRSCELVQAGEEVTVVDAKTQKDITSEFLRIET
jgi:polyhydroxyalkanoate synthesis regulator protein